MTEARLPARFNRPDLVGTVTGNDDEGAPAKRLLDATRRRVPNSKDLKGGVSVVRDILYALRTFRRAPLVTLTIVSTVALGLGLVAAAFTILNALVFRVDAVPDVDEMFALERPRTSGGERQRFTREQFDALRRETNVFTDAYAELSQAATQTRCAYC